MNARTATPQVYGAGDIAARNAMFAIAAVFLGIVLVGWHKLIAPSLGSGSAFLAWPIALFVAVVAIVMAIAVATERVRLQAAGPGAGGQHTWWAYLAVVLTLSALGTMNSMIYFFEGRTILSEAARQTERSLAELQAQAEKRLATPRADKDRRTAIDLMDKLAAELLNPNNCGYGEASRRAVVELRKLLPTFTELSGTLRCSTEAEVARLKITIGSYREQVDKLVRLLPSYTLDNAEVWQGFLATLSQRVKSEQEALQRVQGGLLPSAGHGAMGSTDSYAEAQLALQKAATTYGELATKLNTLAPPMPQMLPVPAELSLDASNQLGAIAQVLPFLASRLHMPRTYLYIGIALLLDLIFIACLMRTLRASRPIAPPAPATPADQDLDLDLTFLWVAPQKELA